MHLVGQLSNPSGPLATVLDATGSELRRPAGLERPIAAEPPSRRLGNGVVQRAVVKVLAAAQRPLNVLEAQAAVVDLLGHPVRKGSINCCLSTGVLGDEPRFERVARGCYRLRHDWLQQQGQAVSSAVVRAEARALECATMGDMAISLHTRKILWSFSGNACALCGTQLVMTPATADDRHAIVGRECHIVAQARSGPRGMSGSRQDLDGYENLILLCANCYAVVDGQPARFPPEKLRELKGAHEQRVCSRWAIPSMPDIAWRGRDQPFQFEPALSGDALLRRLSS